MPGYTFLFHWIRNPKLAMRDATIHLGNKILAFSGAHDRLERHCKGSGAGDKGVETTVKKAAPLTLALLTVSYPVLGEVAPRSPPFGSQVAS